ncbi:hypothetical protein K502DRAFT_348988 [Neoconidiobolus thromboides FSU 785]|nr:hypothetical protein K502DRAFT_348988 [Neoconidiobolus thromboides FSU 785]
MKIIVGHNTGLIRVIQIPKSKLVAEKYLVKKQMFQHKQTNVTMSTKGKVEKTKEVQILEENIIDETDNEMIWIARKDLTIELTDNEEFEPKYVFNSIEFDKEDSKNDEKTKWIGMVCFKKFLLACKSNGTLYQIKLNKDLEAEIKSYQLFKTDIKDRLKVFRGHADKEKVAFATGGDEIELQVWEHKPEGPNQIFIAKNVPHDKLDLRVKVCINDLRFYKDTEQGYKVAIVTHYGQLREYHIKKKRRPVYDFQISEGPCQKVFLNEDENGYFVSTNTGNVKVINASGRQIASYGGFSATVAQLSCQNNIIFSLTIDRNLYLHHAKDHTVIQKIYIKQTASCFLVKEEEADTIESENEDDKLWNQLEENKKKKIKIEEEEIKLEEEEAKLEEKEAKISNGSKLRNH